MQSKFCTISGIDLNKTSFGFDEKHHDCISLKLMLLKKIIELNSIGITDFICNCDTGIPLWAAETILFLKNQQSIHLNVAVPYENQAMRWTDEWRERYYNIHAQADSVKILKTKFTDTCYQECDHFMVDNSDMLLFVGNSDFAIVQYAKQNNKTVMLINL